MRTSRRCLTLSQTTGPCSYVSAVNVFKNTKGKEEIAQNEKLLLFPQCFLPFWTTFFHFHQVQNCRLQILPIWECLKCVVWQMAQDYIQQSRLEETSNNKTGQGDKKQTQVVENWSLLTHSLIHHFKTVPNSKKLQTTTEMWLLKDFKIHIT